MSEERDLTLVQEEIDCNTCGGVGEIDGKVCKMCDGYGTILKDYPPMLPKKKAVKK